MYHIGIIEMKYKRVELLRAAFKIKGLKMHVRMFSLFCLVGYLKHAIRGIDWNKLPGLKITIRR
jgi:hypothetical protein